jgi:hypothetical protein
VKQVNLIERLEEVVGKAVGTVSGEVPPQVAAVTQSPEFKNACTVVGRALCSYGAQEVHTVEIQPCTGAEAIRWTAKGLIVIGEQLLKTEVHELITENVPGITGEIAAGVVDKVL